MADYHQDAVYTQDFRSLVVGPLGVRVVDYRVAPAVGDAFDFREVVGVGLCVEDVGGAALAGFFELLVDDVETDDVVALCFGVLNACDT